MTERRRKQCRGTSEPHKKTEMKQQTPKQQQKKQSILEEEDDEEEEIEKATLESQFSAFVKHLNPDDPATHIGLTEIDMWMKQAGVIQIRKLTRTDTGVCYFKFKKYKLDFEEFNEFLVLLANRKKLLLEDIIEKLINCGPPSTEEEALKVPP